MPPSLFYTALRICDYPLKINGLVSWSVGFRIEWRAERPNYLNGVTTTFTRFRTIVGANTIVVDSQADYLKGTEKSTVASCDIYDFVDAKLVSITSYAVEL